MPKFTVVVSYPKDVPVDTVAKWVIIGNALRVESVTPVQEQPSGSYAEDAPPYKDKGLR